jgi:hypothetical protein
MATRKDSGAVALGRKGGKKRAENLAPEERRRQAREAAQARWAEVTGHDRERARAAILRVRRRARAAGGFDWEALKRDRDEGRR